MDFKETNEKLVQYIQWDQMQLNYILLGGIVGAMFYQLIELDLDITANIGYHAVLAYYVIQSYKEITKFYRRQIQNSISSVVSKIIQPEIKCFRRQSRQVQIYYLLLLTSILLDLWAQIVLFLLDEENSVLLYIFLTTASSSCLFLFSYLSIKHYVEIFGEVDSDQLPPQVVVIKGFLFVLGLVFWKYTSTKTESLIRSLSILLLFIISSMNSIITISRFGYTSKKSLANLLIGCLLKFLSEALRQVQFVQNKPIYDLKTISSIICFLAWYMIVSGIFLHIKAFTDCKLIELRVRCRQLQMKSDIIEDTVEMD